MSRLDRETLTGVDITPADGLLVLTKALPTSLAEWALKGIVRVSALAASKTRTLTLTVKTDGEHVFSTDWVFESDATDAGRVKRMAFRVPEDIRGTVTLHLHSTEATDTTVDVDARLNTDVDDVPNTWFVDATYGHDTEHDGRSWQTAFLTIDAAIAVAASGDTICTGPGIFALGAAVIELPDGVNLQGKGIDATLITSTAVLSTLGCIVKPGTGSRIADLTIQGIAGAGVYQAALGYRKASAGAPTQARFLHAWADRVRLIADADGVYIREEPDPGTRCDLVMRDCLIETKYDGVTIISRNASIVLYDTRIVVIGPSSCGGQYAHGLAGIGGSDAFISMVRGSLEVSGATVSNVGAQEARGRIILSDVHVDTAGAAPMDLVQADNGSVFVFGSVFDPAKTSGTIIHVPPGASILADTAALEARLTAERAARLDADVSSRATPADVTGAHGMTDGLIGGLGSPEQDGAVATAHATTDGKVDGAAASAASADGKLPADTETKLARLDVTVGSRAAPAQVKTQADQALVDYDGPTKAEMDAAHALLAIPADVHTTVLPGQLVTNIPAYTLSGIFEQNLVLNQAADRDIVVQLLDRDSEPIVITGLTLQLRVWDEGVSKFDMTTPIKIEITDGAEGQMTWHFSRTDLAAVFSGIYEFWAVGVEHLIYGRGLFSIQETEGPSV